MKLVDKEQGEQELQSILADRFRKERLRLGLSTTDVAHYCGVSVSSVFSWEAKRSRIPLLAAACLWKHGFDVESIIAGQDELQDIPVLAEGEEFSDAKPRHLVPLHMVSRHRSSIMAVFVYHNIAYSKDLAAPGDLILMGLVDEPEEDDLKETMTILFRPVKQSLSEFMCKIRSAGKGRLLVQSDDVSATISRRSMFEHGAVYSESYCRIGYKPITKQADKTHSRRLGAYLKHIRAS